MTAAELLPRLEMVRSRGLGKWAARCPGHADKNPSLSITETDSKILLYCFAGCDRKTILTALSVKDSDLFLDAPLSRGHRLVPHTPRLNRRALAFRCELYALDLRMRAERVLSAVAVLKEDGIDDCNRDRLMEVIASAHRDEERAELFEHVADTLNWKAFGERTVRHAA